MLTIKFENLRMLEDKSLSYFYAKLCDIANKSFILGEKFLDAKLSKKLLDP